jgi:hypothetical protein
MVLGQLDIHTQKNELGCYFSMITKINSKWGENIRSEITKGKCFRTLGWAKVILDKSSKVHETRADK